MIMKMKLITQAIKQETMPIIFSARARVTCWLLILVDADDYYRLPMRQCFQNGS